jgi:quinate dehydrogenase (quinone)
MQVLYPRCAGLDVHKDGLDLFCGNAGLLSPRDRFLDRARSVEGGRLPVGAGATPMTYVSPRSKRQFIVISASGARESLETGDYLIAYALPSSG